MDKTRKPTHKRPQKSPTSAAPERVSRRKRSLAAAVATATGVVLPVGAHGGVVQGGPAEPLAERVVAPIRAERKPVAVPVNWALVKQTAPAAVAQAVAGWKAAAVLSGVVVNAVTAVGGTLSGPSLDPKIRASMVGAGVPADVAGAFASVVSSAWAEWAASVRVPGLPWYPTFAALPMPVAPPTANVPTPLMALVMNDTPLTAPALASALRTALGARAKERGASAAVDQFAENLALRFTLFLAQCMVTKVLGTGPIPTFAPPYVPVGPVVGGTATMSPGGLVGSWPTL